MQPNHDTPKTSSIGPAGQPSRSRFGALGVEAGTAPIQSPANETLLTAVEPGAAVLILGLIHPRMGGQAAPFVNPGRSDEAEHATHDGRRGSVAASPSQHLCPSSSLTPAASPQYLPISQVAACGLMETIFGRSRSG